MQRIEENKIVNLTFEFAKAIMNYAVELEQQRRFVVANQLLKSGTSIGANVREAQNAESKKDFLHKFKIAAKEADETEYWLMLCSSMDKYPSIGNLLEEILVIKKILSKIISSTKRISMQQGNSLT